MADSSSKLKKSVAHHIEQTEKSDGRVSDETFRNINSVAVGPSEPADEVTQAEATSAVSPETQQRKVGGVAMEEEQETTDRPCEKQVEQAVPVSDTLVMKKYEDYPLVRSMLSGESIRNQTLLKDGHKQIDYVKSNDGWVKTLLVVEGRALDNILLPWILVTMNATIWTCIVELHHIDWIEDTDKWEFFIGIVLNTSLAFLLVFRLNRAASRFWLARECWGTIVGATRHLVSGIQMHADHDAKNQRLAVMWVAAFAIATMQYMRSIEDIPPDMLLGILDPADVKLMEMSLHPPLYAADKVRAALKEVFHVTTETPTALAIARTEQMNTLEQTLNKIMDQEGSMERIRSTPLPLVYVAHLRIFLIIYLLVLPYVWLSSLGWFTIPVVFLSGFALLGLEGIAIEVEAPFRRGRSNHLNMDGFCLMILQTTQQTIRDAADSEIAKKATDDVAGDVETEDENRTAENSVDSQS